MRVLDVEQRKGVRVPHVGVSRSPWILAARIKGEVLPDCKIGARAAATIREAATAMKHIPQTVTRWLFMTTLLKFFGTQLSSNAFLVSVGDSFCLLSAKSLFKSRSTSLLNSRIRKNAEITECLQIRVHSRQF